MILNDIGNRVALLLHLEYENRPLIVVNLHLTFPHYSFVSEPPPSVGLHGPFGQMILDYRSTINYAPITYGNINQLHANQTDLRLRIAVRERLLNKREIATKDNDMVTISNKDHSLVHGPKWKAHLTKYFDNQTFK